MFVTNVTLEIDGFGKKPATNNQPLNFKIGVYNYKFRNNLFFKLLWFLAIC